jgi:hypothetical protein
MTEPLLEPLHRYVGTWTTEATHPAMPGLVVHGTVEMTWLEGERFLIHRARTDHADFPDSISIIGITDEDRVDDGTSTVPDRAGASLSMHYYDSRGVAREYEALIGDDEWRIWRDAPGFSQRFTGPVVDGGATIDGLWRMCTDDVTWHDDLQITYRRRS